MVKKRKPKKQTEFRTLLTRDGGSVRIPKKTRPKNRKKRARVVDLLREKSNIDTVKHKHHTLQKKVIQTGKKLELHERLKARDEKIDWDSIDPDEPIPFTLTEKGLKELERLRADVPEPDESITSEGQHRVLVKNAGNIPDGIYEISEVLE